MAPAARPAGWASKAPRGLYDPRTWRAAGSKERGGGRAAGWTELDWIGWAVQEGRVAWRGVAWHGTVCK